MDVISWVRGELRTRGIRQNVLGSHMGWQDSQTSKVLNGDRPLRADELLKIMDYLGIAFPPFAEGGEPVTSDADAISRLAAGLSEEQQQALLVYLKLLPQK